MHLAARNACEPPSEFMRASLAVPPVMGITAPKTTARDALELVVRKLVALFLGERQQLFGRLALLCPGALLGGEGFNPVFQCHVGPLSLSASIVAYYTFRDLTPSSPSGKILHDYPDSSDCFPGVEIKGGVCYFLWDRDNEGDCKVFSHHLDVVSESERPLLEPGNDVFIRDNEAIEILGRIKSQKSFSDIVSPQNPFGFNTAHHGHQEKKSGDIKYIIRGREVEYIAPGSVTSHKEWIEKWKVLIPKAGEGAALPNKVLGKPFIAGPGTSCSGTYMVIGPFDNRDQCVNAIRYIQTTFFRYLVSLKKITQDTKTSTYSFVPMQDFNKEWTDEKLCEKYGITAEELDYMKRLITPMTIESSEIEV